MNPTLTATATATLILKADKDSGGSLTHAELADLFKVRV